MFFHTANTAYGEFFSIKAAQRVMPPGGGKTTATPPVIALSPSGHYPKSITPLSSGKAQLQRGQTSGSGQTGGRCHVPGLPGAKAGPGVAHGLLGRWFGADLETHTLIPVNKIHLGYNGGGKGQKAQPGLSPRSE